MEGKVASQRTSFFHRATCGQASSRGGVENHLAGKHKDLRAHCCRFGEGTRILGCKECQAASCPKCKHGKSVRGFEHLLVFFAQSCTTTQQYTVTTSGEVGFSHRLVDSCGISSQVPLARTPTHRSQNKKLPIFDRPQPTPEQIVELFLPLQAVRQNLTLKNRHQRSCLKRVRMSLYKNIPRIS